MKKQVLLSISALVCFMSLSVLVSAQSVKGIHPWDVTENNRGKVSEEDANWSLFLHGGFNVFDGDFNANQGKEMKHAVSAPTVGLGLEYKFNPTWGLGVDYSFRRVSVTGNTSLKDDEGNPQNLANLLRGNQHNASLYLSLDLFNLFCPNVSTKLFALNVIAGGSFLAYKNSNQTPVSMSVRSAEGVRMNVPAYWKNKTGSKEYQAAYPDGSDQRQMSKYDFASGFMGGVDFEFNINRSLALGLRALYHFYTSDKLDGRYNVNTRNDGEFDTELLLRWKIQADKKSHVNNYISRGKQAERVSVAQRPVVVQQEVVTPQQQQPKVVQVASRTDTVYVYHRDTVNFVTRDTVEIFHRDTVSMTIYNTRRDTLYILDGQLTNMSKPDGDQRGSFYVYFDLDSYELSEEGYAVVQQIADRLYSNPDLCVSIIGYYDGVGDAEHNKRLGQYRSQSVYDELLLEYGIDAERMFAISRNIIVGRRSGNLQYAPNRRVEIRVVDTRFFNTLRTQYRANIESQKEAIKNRPEQ